MLLSQKDNNLYGLITFGPEDKIISKQIFSDYISVNGTNITSTLTGTNLEGSDYANIYGMDITIRKKAKEDLERFVSTVSHELRTPISVLVLSIEYLNKHPEQLTDELRNQLNNTIEKNTYLLKDLIEDTITVTATPHIFTRPARFRVFPTCPSLSALFANSLEIILLD